METKRALPERPWLIVVLLALGQMISFLDRSSLSSALADHGFVQQFGLSSVERGWLSSAFFWSYGLMQMPMGWLVDRYGVKWPYAVCLTVWCVAAATTGLVGTLPALIGVRLLIGMAEGVVLPATYRYLANRFAEHQRGTALGIFSIGGKMGPALGGLIGAWLIVHQSWQTMFFATGLAGLLWLWPWLTQLRNDYPSRGELAARAAQAATVPLRRLLASPVIWGGLLNNFCYGYFYIYCMTWMPAYLVEQRGLSLQRSGVYTFFSFAGIAIVAALAGWSADRLIARGHDALRVRKAFIVTGFIGATTVLLGAYADTLQMALLWNVVSLSLLGLVTANNLALTKLTLIPQPAVGLSTGLLQVATSLAGGVSASLSGWLLHISGGYALPMQAIFVFLLLGAASTLLLFRRQWAPAAAS
ncbi:MFS family permease [Duganella sp. 1224]|uniref:MFS transporter n=1 Tax=Duganella sp. 1224 TaxID=2587052 RepID=UPI0015CE5EB7|nr:MFS transporter [Duganella sp. 1224]NYE58850.1 MFS family permease [Duganella sp. 1224]